MAKYPHRGRAPLNWLAITLASILGVVLVAVALWVWFLKSDLTELLAIFW